MHLFTVLLFQLFLLLLILEIQYNDCFIIQRKITPLRPLWHTHRPHHEIKGYSDIKSGIGHQRLFAIISKALDEPMLDDFNKIILSLKIYSQFHSETTQRLRIPLKFEVPSTPDWPEYLHGFPLGKRLKRLVLSEKFKDQSPDKVKMIESLGFQLHIKNILSEWDIIYEALVSYKKIYGDLNIDNNFEVPAFSTDSNPWPSVTHGLKLGSRVCAIRNSGAHVRVDNDRKKMLDDLGFLWDKPKKEKKNSNSSGGTDESGFPISRNSDDKFNLFLEALINYKTLNGDLAVPTSFIIPVDSSDYPEHLWGFKLGNRVSLIRSQGLFVSSFPERKQILDDIGFIWDTPSKRRKVVSAETLTNQPFEETKIGEDHSHYSSLEPEEIFQEENQFPLLKNFFQFENDEPENRVIPPERLFDLRLFHPTNMSLDQYHVDSNNDQVQYREEVSKKLLVAINKYNENSDDFFPVSEIKPMLSGIPPPTFKGVRVLRYLKHRIYEYDNFFFEDIYEALYQYREIFGNIDIPRDFVLTESFLLDHPSINPDFKGMKLGEYMEALRIGDFEGKYHKDRRPYLDSLGFNWGDPHKHIRVPFYPFIQALKLYYYLFSDATPPNDFVIPDEDPWPHALVGCPLGKWASYARLQKDTLAKYYPERVQILDALGFVWWVPADFELTEDLE